MVRAGINESHRIDQLYHDSGWGGECFYRRLLNVVDDYGCFDGRSGFVRAKCYPTLLDSVRETDVQRWIAACEKAGLVRLYTSDGRQFIEVLRFRQTVRIKRREWPEPPPGDEAQMHLTCGADEAHMRPETKRNETKPPDPPAGGLSGFDRFWASWPKHPLKSDKKTTKTRWVREKCEDITDRILASLEQWKRSTNWTKDGGRYISAPEVWISKHRWESEGIAPANNGCPNVSSKPRPVEPDVKAKLVREAGIEQAFQQMIDPSESQALLHEYQRTHPGNESISERFRPFREWAYDTLMKEGRIKAGAA